MLIGCAVEAVLAFTERNLSSLLVIDVVTVADYSSRM